MKIYLVLLSFVLLISISCDENNTTSVDNTSPEITSTPKILLNPNNNTPLSALLTFETNEPTRASVYIDVFDGTVQNAITGNEDSFVIDFDEFGTSHELPILGLKSNKLYTLNLTVEDESGNTTTDQELLEFETEPMKGDLPELQCNKAVYENMEPGFTLFNVRPFGNSSANDSLLIINHLCEVVWIYNSEERINDTRRLHNGNLLLLNPRRRIIEINMLGNIINAWIPALSPFADFELENKTIPVDTLTFHHEVFKMDNGNYLVLSIEGRQYPNYPSSETDPSAPAETATAAGDVIVEFTPDGEIVNQWSMLDMLDPYRIGYDSLSGFSDQFFDPALTGPTRDWSHGNAVIHDPSDNSIIVSLRHQDAVVKFSRETGELIWIFGPHENWDQEIFGEYLLDPVGENFLWQYHQHAPMITEDGNLLLFDNGNYRASPFDPKLSPKNNFSRAVEYKINRNTMEVEQVWEYGEFAEEIIYSSFLCDADYLPVKDNILITFGGINKNEAGEPSEGPASRSGVSARIIEVTHTENPEVVFDVSIAGKNDNFPGGWAVYRSERIPSLYP